MVAIVTEDKCTGCGDCVETCPCEAIEVFEEKAKVDDEKCSDCAACVDACPSGAIAVD